MVEFAARCRQRERPFGRHVPGKNAIFALAPLSPAFVPHAQPTVHQGNDVDKDRFVDEVRDGRTLFLSRQQGAFCRAPV